MKYFFVFFIFVLWLPQTKAQNVWAFNSLEPIGQTDSLTIPATHRFQVLTVPQQVYANNFILPKAPDYTCFVPINGSSESGYISLNHELSAPNGRITVFDALFNTTTKLWSATNPQPVDLSPVVSGGKFCSGMLTPWGNVLSGEEGVTTYDENNDGYHDHGWLVETNPETKVAVRKLYKLGKMRHENACISKNKKTLYFGPDDSDGYLFKFEANNPGKLWSGTLYVLKLENEEATTGEWIQVPNNTPEACNTVIEYAASVGATDFGPIEDVEIGKDSKIYFACKNSGRIRRLKDNGLTVSECQIFVEPGNYVVNTVSGPQIATWGNGSDNLAFDKIGNLWVCHDGSGSFSDNYNYVWVVGANHTTAQPNLRIFMSTPNGSEPTGLTFSPDYRFIFLSIQFLSTGSFSYIAHDVANKPINFRKGATIVIARKEKIGSGAITQNMQFADDLDWQSYQEPRKITINPSLVSYNSSTNIALSDEVVGRCQIRLSSMNGTLVWSQYIDISELTNLVNLTIPDVSAGGYFVSVLSSDNVQSGFIMVH